MVEKSTLVAIIAFICLPFFSETAFYTSKESTIPFTIVIDAGHGGKDSGALGAVVKEKDIALKLALKLGQYTKQYMSNVRVLYTRTSDQFVPLHERVAMANINHADLFFSIHCNSLVKPTNTVAGTETYVMGLHRAEENLNVAKRENKAILLEQNYASNYSGYDPNSSEGHIMLSMYQNAYLSQSLLLAEKVQQQFVHTAKRKSRGVKQAGFLVLRAATMPAVLVEAGFLSNTIEESYLNSEKGQVYIASAMYRALKEYKKEVENNTNPNYQKVTGRSSYNNTTYKYNSSTQTPHHTFVPKHIDLTPKENKQLHKNTLSPNNPSITHNPSIHNPSSIKNNPSTHPSIIHNPSTHHPSSTQNNPPTHPSITHHPPIHHHPSIEEIYPTTLQQNNRTTFKQKQEGVLFRIQLAAAKQKINLNLGVWASLEGIECLKIGTTYKCMTGKYSSLEAALAAQTHWRKKGFTDAFIVAFKNGQKISIKEARS